MKNIILKLNGPGSQFLGRIDNKTIIIKKGKAVSLSEKEWSLIEERKWNQHLIKNGILIVNKKKSKIEKDVDEGKIELNEEEN